MGKLADAKQAELDEARARIAELEAESETDSVADTALDEYKKLVRRVAIRVAKEQSWCDDGLNKVLEELFLPKKQTFRVPVEVTAKRRVSVLIDDAVTQEEADARVREGWDGQRLTREQLGGGFTYLEHEVLEPGASDPDVPLIGTPTGQLSGEWYSPNSYRWCGNRDGGNGYTCSRPRDHAGSTHVASTSYEVVDIWEGV